MSKGNTFETEFLELIFNNVAIALIGDAAGVLPSAANGSLYVSLHTADPGEAGNQTTSETVYTNYARIAVARNPGAKKWTVSNGSASNAEVITFATCGATGATITHFAIGVSLAGVGKILYKGPLNSNLAVSTNIAPEFAAGQLVVSED